MRFMILLLLASCAGPQVVKSVETPEYEITHYGAADIFKVAYWTFELMEENLPGWSIMLTDNWMEKVDDTGNVTFIDGEVVRDEKRIVIVAVCIGIEQITFQFSHLAPL